MECARNWLASRGFDVTTVEQHKFYGWFFESTCNGATVWSMLQGAEPWLMINEPHHSFLKRLFGQTQSEPLAKLCGAINEFLTNSPEATNVRWVSRSEYQTQAGANRTTSA